MLKLKEKFLLKKYYKTIFLFALVLSLGSAFLLPSKVLAATYQPSDMQVKLGTYVPGVNNQFRSDNLIQVGKEIGSVTIQAEITLVAPQTLVLGTDTFDMNTADNGQGGVTITGLGAGMLNMGTGTDAGGVGCDKSTVWVFAARSNYEYLTCPFKVKNAVTSGTLTANNSVKVNLTVNFSDYDLNRNNASSTQRIIVYPYVTFDRGLLGRLLVFPKGGFPVYVRFYNSQNDANTAIASGVRPPDAPTYGGGTTSNGQADPTGSSILGFVNTLIGIVLGFIQEAIYFIFYWLVAPLIQSMLSVHTYTDAFVGVIYPGWIVVRNISNMVFIVALIIIGLATLFRIESYQYKHLLVQLVMAALLVNFSLVIGQAILGVADTIQSQFLPNNVEVVRSLAKDMMVAYRSQAYNVDFAAKGTFSVTVQQLFWVALSLGSFCVFLAIAVFLVIRIVALWILLLISPAAYVAGILPTTHHYQEQWWSTFLKYAFFTPLMAFFLNMTAVMIGANKENPVLKQIMHNPQSLGLDNFASFVLSVASNILLLVFLIAGLKVADQFGIYGASAITSIAQKGIYAPFALSGMGTKAAAGKFGQMYAKYTTKKIKEHDTKGNGKRAFLWRGAQLLNPKIAKKAWEERAHDKELEAYSEATGMSRDTFNRFMPTEWSLKHRTMGQKTYYGKIGHENMIAHKRSEWEKANLTMPEKVAAFEGAHHKEEVEALLYIMTDGRHEDDWMRKVKEGKIGEIKAGIKSNLIEQGVSEEEAEKLAEERAGAYYDKVEYGDLIYKKLIDGGATHEDAVRAISHLQEYAEGQNKGRVYGITVEDPVDGIELASNLNSYKNEKDSSKLLSRLNELGIFKEGSRDEQGRLTELKFEIKDRKTNKVIETKSIKNNEDLNNIINETAKKYGNYYDHAYKVGDLGYAMTGARSWKYDGMVRQNRGSTENHMKNRERGEVAVMSDKFGIIGATSYGERATVELNDLTTAVVEKLRNLPPRALQEIGISKGNDGTTKVDHLQLAIKMNQNLKLVQNYLSQAKLKPQEMQGIVDNINAKGYWETAGFDRKIQATDLLPPVKEKEGGSPGGQSRTSSPLVDQFGHPIQ